MEYNDVYELAEHFKKMSDAIEYPQKQSKPMRSEFASNADWGAAMDEYEENALPEYRKAKELYSKSVSEINKQFKDSLLEFLGISKHPKATILYDMAWDRGHSGGYSEVAMEAEELTQLLSWHGT